jgi:hypothetical protein
MGGSLKIAYRLTHNCHPSKCSAAIVGVKLFTRDEARRIAANIHQAAEAVAQAALRVPAKKLRVGEPLVFEFARRRATSGTCSSQSDSTAARQRTCAVTGASTLRDARGAPVLASRIILPSKAVILPS